jgi:hypothetical protein
VGYKRAVGDDRWVPSLTSAWEVGNARRGLESIRGPRKKGKLAIIFEKGVEAGIVRNGRDVHFRGGNG